jgi:hypothetical protein
MEEQAPNYRGEFLRSPHHMVFGLLTLGLGFLSGDWLPLIAGCTVYSLGWIYLPDLGFFRRWVDSRRTEAQRHADAEKIARFVQRREALLSSLSQQRREKYRALARVCQDIERASADTPLASPDPSTDPRLRKLDELMWTYLRLLGIEESVERFLETERREDVPETVKHAEAELAELTGELERLKAKGQGPLVETRQRYLNSRLERLDVLRKRLERFEQAVANLALVVSEQERLDQQIKLIRADAVATKNADALTARIDATVEHLDQTNKWLSEMDEFKDLVTDMPPTESRVGYEVSPAAPIPTAVPPPVIGSPPIRRQEFRTRARN